MKKRHLVASLGAISLILAGCSIAGVDEFGALMNPGPKFDLTQLVNPNKNEAIIYYYRPIEIAPGVRHIPVYENGERVTSFYAGGYFVRRTTPGFKVIATKIENSAKVRFNAEPGKTYFVRGEITLDPYFTLKQIIKEQAVLELRNCALLPPDAD